MWPTISIMHKMLLTWNLCSCSSWNHVQHNCHRWVPLRLRFVLFLLIYCGLFKTCCTCNFTTWLFRQGCVYSQRGSCEGNKKKQKHVNCLFESFSVLKVDIFWIQLGRWISCLAIEAKMTPPSKSDINCIFPKTFLKVSRPKLVSVKRSEFGRFVTSGPSKMFVRLWERSPVCVSTSNSHESARVWNFGVCLCDLCGQCRYASASQPAVQNKCQPVEKKKKKESSHLNLLFVIF